MLNFGSPTFSTCMLVKVNIRPIDQNFVRIAMHEARGAAGCWIKLENV